MEANATEAKADGESEVQAKIAEMPQPDRAMAERFHALVKAASPDLSPRTWYGMPAYAKDGKVVCFFNRREVQGELRELRVQGRGAPRRGCHVADLLRADRADPADEKRIVALVKKAVR